MSVSGQHKKLGRVLIDDKVPKGERSGMIFLADGDALCLSNAKLLAILDAIRELFPECERVGVYGRATDILRKSPGELEALREAGIGLPILILGYTPAEYGRELAELGIEGHGLGGRAREAIQDEPDIGIGLLQTVDNQADDNVVGYKLAGIHVRLRLQAELGAGGNGGAKHVAC